MSVATGDAGIEVAVDRSLPGAGAAGGKLVVQRKVRGLHKAIVAACRRAGPAAQMHLGISLATGCFLPEFIRAEEAMPPAFPRP